MVPVADADKVARAWRHNADAITLDLEDRIEGGAQLLGIDAKDDEGGD